MNAHPSIDRLPSHRHSDVEIEAGIDEMQRRITTLRNSLSETSPMKYALESLPELIGEHQFLDLCLAMGIETAEQLPSGQDFADIVSKRVLRFHRERDDYRRRQNERGL